MAKIKRDPSLMESLNSFLKSTNFISEPKIYNRIASFHSKKVEFILQEIFARLVMYNFSVAAHICREYFLGRVTPPNIEALISRYITPIRPGRSRPRNMIPKSTISLMYRVA
jgi:hypothetical protein